MEIQLSFFLFSNTFLTENFLSNYLIATLHGQIIKTFKMTLFKYYDNN